MIHIVEWMPEAEITFNENIEYLAKKWNLEVIISFLDRVDEVINHIGENPFLYPSYKEYKDVRKCPVTKQITLFYRIKETQIHLLTFWNNFQHPDRLKL